MNKTIRIYLTNLGKYNEGKIKGQWVELPIDEDDFEEVLNNIGINEEYEEYFIADYETDIEGLDIGEYSNIEQLNELIEKFGDLDECEIEQLNALLESGDITFDLIFKNDISDLLYNHTFIELSNTFLSDDKNLGYSYIEEVYGGDLSCIANISYHFDMEAFARDLSFDKDMIIENLDNGSKKYYENMTDVEFAEDYIEQLGNIEELGQETLERYFDYESFGRDLSCEGVYIASNNIVVIS
ncbi:antirestriction protein ArdA [Clostridioides difficile]|nr:antirestriction protein ArdA [Clostridioides difficile]